MHRREGEDIAYVNRRGLYSFCVAVALALMSFASGCGQPCTQAGCGRPMMLSLLDAHGQPVLGYSVEVTGYGHTWTVVCSATVPSGDGGAMCNGTVDLSIAVSGGFLIPDENTTLRIRTDQGSVWFGRLSSISPPFYPNGPSCDPACYHSPITFTLPQ